MTYQEYNDRRNDMVNAYNNGEMNLPDWSKRAEEALAKMKETHRKVKQEWAHACLDGGRVKVKKGAHGLLLVDMSILEARLLANEMLSITNKQRRKR